VVYNESAKKTATSPQRKDDYKLAERDGLLSPYDRYVKMNISRQMSIGVAVLVVALLVGGVVSCSCQPKDISINVITPLHVAKGEGFVFEIQVENTAEKSQLLYSVDIWDDYLAGIAIQKTEPGFIDTYHIPIDNTQCYEFKRDIPPKDTLVVKFFAVGLEPGEYSSYVDVCINTGTSFLTHPITTIIED
jgi:hypothetical protein